MKQHGIVIVERGSAIVTIERDATDHVVVTGIERLPFDLRAVAARVRQIKEPDATFVIDAEGLGQALWTVLADDRRPRRPWKLYDGRGLERQALVDTLVVAVEEDRLRFAAALDEQDAMNKALLGYKRQVRDDGVIGSELVVALLLALVPRPKPPMIY